MQTLEGYEICKVKWKKTLDECSVISTKLNNAETEIGNLQSQINTVRKLIDEEKKKKKLAEKNRDYYISTK